MGPGPREERTAGALKALLVGTVLIVAGPASADPIVTAPRADQGLLAECPDCFHVGLIGEANILAIVGADRNTTFPEIGAVAGGEPELARVRLGLVGDYRPARLRYLVRLDLAEALRIPDDWRDHPAAVASSLVDDAALWWAPRPWLELGAGRLPVSAARFRHVDRGLMMAGAVPFVIDRIAPDRRWGGMAHGDLGAMSYALGGFVDADAVEPRPLLSGDEADLAEARAIDPSAGGTAMLAARVEWTPRAPIGADLAPTPGEDPWFSTWRPSGGLGVVIRDGRQDVLLSGQSKWRHLATIVELIVSFADGVVALSAAGETSVLLGERFVLFGRADADGALDTFTTGGGLSYFATEDRRNRVAFFGWRRTDDASGAIVQLQAAF